MLSFVVPELLRKEFISEEQAKAVTNKEEFFFLLRQLYTQYVLPLVLYPPSSLLTRFVFFLWCRDKPLLLLLLGVDKLYAEPVGSAHCLRSFCSELLSRCAHLKMVLTCARKFGGFKGALEHETVVGPLSPLDAARLFSQLSPRPLTLAEIG